MKSLLLIRSPLFRRKKILGIFKSRKKTLGKIYIDQHEKEIVGKRIQIITTTFSRSLKTADVICDMFDLDKGTTICIDSIIQDLDAEKCIDILNRTFPEIDTLVLIAPGVTVSTLFYHLTGTQKILPLGQCEVIKFDISEWNSLTNNEIKMGGITILKSA